MEFIPAGLLNSTVAIQEIETTNINGSRVGENWIDVYQAHAVVRTLTGQKQFLYGQQFQTIGYEILFRYKNDIPFSSCSEGEIKQKYRLVEHNGDGSIRRIFSIHTVVSSNSRNTYKIICSESK